MNTTTSSVSTTSTNNKCILTDEEIICSYNLTHHIISVFVILVVSFLGAAISVVSTRVKCLHISPIIINAGKFFGSGYVKYILKILKFLFHFLELY
jgi:hypothetical protein